MILENKDCLIRKAANKIMRIILSMCGLMLIKIKKLVNLEFCLLFSKNNSIFNKIILFKLINLKPMKIVMKILV